MSSRLVKLKIIIKKNPETIENTFNNLFKIENLRKTIQNVKNILLINLEDTELINQMISKLGVDTRLIVLLDNPKNVLSFRKKINNNNVLFFNNNIEANEIKSHIINVLFGYNFIYKSKNINHVFREINRIINTNTEFTILENFSLEDNFFKNFFKNKNDISLKLIIFGLKKLIKNIKNIEYDVEVIGKGNKNFKSSGNNALTEYTDFINEGAVVENRFQMIIKAKRT